MEQDGIAVSVDQLRPHLVIPMLLSQQGQHGEPQGQVPRESQMSAPGQVLSSDSLRCLLLSFFPRLSS